MMRSEIANYYNEAPADLTGCVGLYALHNLNSSLANTEVWGDIDVAGNIQFDSNGVVDYSALSGSPRSVNLILDEADTLRSNRVDKNGSVVLNPSSRSITN